MHLRPVLCLCACFLATAAGAAGPPSARAGSEAEARAELARIQARIHKVTEGVHADAASRDEAAAALKAAEDSLADARSRLDEARERRAAAAARDEKLKAERDQARARLDRERAALAADLRVSYRNGRDEPLKLLLNARDPAELGRLLDYYGYFGRARAARIHAIEGEVSHLEALEAELAQEHQALAAATRDQESEVRALNTARSVREHAYQVVAADLDSKSTELVRLRANATSLEKLVTQLREALRDSPPEDYGSAQRHRQPFAELKGRLAWPAHGTVVAQFGSPKPGGLVWQGLLLDTEPGTPVRAPAYGRVVYADWLTGLGLLLILDHGGGYLTLYGNNEQLYRKVGDNVAPGEVLAATSASPGAMAPQVYFEIRRGKGPEDPRSWLKPASRN